MPSSRRFGFHYFPDAAHYRKSDLEHWLPRLTSLDTGWLILNAPGGRAIPESFISGLLKANIEPILQFPYSFKSLPDKEDLRLLLRVYARWGVRHVSLFNKPNVHQFWGSSNWTREDLVERFLDLYLPLAEICLESNLNPIYPPLEPGGDYWDTVFLKASLLGIKRRGHTHLLDKIIIGAVARENGLTLNWGTGGPERWPNTSPYSHSEGCQDHLGFRIFDWYQAIIQSCLVKSLPIFLFEVKPIREDNFEVDQHTQNSFSIVKLLHGTGLNDLDQIQENVIGAAFWQLAAEEGIRDSNWAWFKPGGETLPIVQTIQDWILNTTQDAPASKTISKNIKHYLLLPGSENSDLELDLDYIRPVVHKHKPTIGFSIEEAKQAERVTIININGWIQDQLTQQLRQAGCTVQQIDDVAQLLHL